MIGRGGGRIALPHHNKCTQARRDVVRIFRYFLERQTDSTVKYIIKNQVLVTNLISG